MGQFLDRYGQTKETVTRPFLERLETVKRLDDFASCFPFLPLSVKAPVDVFYDFYRRS